MLRKILSIAIISILFVLCVIYVVPHDKTYKVLDVKSPVDVVLENGDFIFPNFNTFDSTFSKHNKELALKNNISEEEAFVLGNIGKYWAGNLLKGRSVYINDKKDLIYFKYSYLEKFKYSGFCFDGDIPFSKDAFTYRLNGVRKANYRVLDLDSDKVYSLSDKDVRSLKHFLVVRKSHLKSKKKATHWDKVYANYILSKGDITILFADSFIKLKPDRKCETNICREILTNINNAQSTIDMAIYGYSRVPAIEEAIKSAIARGVKIRLIYDVDAKGHNIYPDTDEFVRLISQNVNDKFSPDVRAIMHNKFYIFDDKVLIAGSANLSHTDMSGFNSNSVIVIKSPEVAQIYKQEFEQMYFGKFHTQKVVYPNKRVKLANTKISFYFSPQDKSIANAILPIINSSKSYIYIPTFLLTEKRVCDALILAHKRGVDVRVIIDALNASGKYSKHQYLRDNGVAVKTENYAGKMHSKSLIADDKYTIIGSMNFSYSGENKNDENLMVIEDSVIAKFYKNNFLYQWNKIDNKWLKYNAKAEGKDSIGSCSDGIDNDYDGLVDMDDTACK